MAQITNPILPGFHPDPSILRVGEDYYLATSTFEWWPGVRLHHSRDLANWRLLGSILTRRSQLNMRGNPPSGGIWAPALSHHDGLFWLIFTDVKSLNGPAKDLRNYLVTAPSITGPWSDPVALNTTGFDPSLFHDRDGRKWLVNQQWDPRPGENHFPGIVLQEYCPRSRRLLGSPTTIFRGSSLGITEGPHLYWKDGYYYLVTAEGGTGDEHAVTVARSRTLTGPYELPAAHPLLTSADDPSLPLQKAGHASFVQTPAGDWYLVHLCGRPLGPDRRCMLGRETALQAVVWPEGGWPRLAHGGHHPATTVAVPGTPTAPYGATFTDTFSGPDLAPEWSTLREPAEPAWCTVGRGSAGLRLRGRHSLQSCFDVSLVGFRLLHTSCQFQVDLDFPTTDWEASAALSLFYNPTHYVSLVVSGDGHGGREARLHVADGKDYVTPPNARLTLPTSGRLRLRGELTDGRLTLSVGSPTGASTPLVVELDATFLSDDYLIRRGTWGFTGCFITLSAHDTRESDLAVGFFDFVYRAT